MIRDEMKPRDPTRDVLIVNPELAKIMREHLSLLVHPWRCGWCHSPADPDLPCPRCKDPNP